VDTGVSRFPDPFSSRDDPGHASAFLIALLLLVTVTAILFFGNTWIFEPVHPPSFLAATALPSVQAGSRGATEPPPFTAPTPVPPLAGVPYRPSPTGTVTRTPGPVTPSPTAPPPTPTSSTPTPAPTYRVGNTGGDGVFLRRTPHLGDRWIAWRDGTPMVPVGGEADSDGEHWIQVRDPRGNVGWVPVRYLVR